MTDVGFGVERMFARAMNRALKPATQALETARGRVPKRLIGSAIAVLLAVVIFAGHRSAEAEVMQLGGQFGVSETGSATYKIPIAVPPGTGGMVPSLSLDYDSQSGNGIVGVGWTLNGLLSVTRCPATVAQDGIQGRIGYDAGDRFCMDGHRLVAISGTYGADGTEYRTDVDGFSKVISRGTAGSGPAWFEVKTKSGQTMQFGNTTDSKILAAGTSTIRLWALNRVTDTKTNYLTIAYSFTAGTSTTPAEHYPTRIDYTGNTAASLAPNASVQFSYDTARTDVMTSYQAGSSLTITRRLTNIKTYIGANLVMDYQLVYETGPASLKSRLISLTACGADGACLLPTKFEWSGTRTSEYPRFGADTNGTWTAWMTSPGAFGSSAPVFGDFSGDGLTDVLINANGTFYSARSTGTNFATPVTTSIAGKSPQLVQIVGNGRDDLLAINSANHLMFYPSTGTGFGTGVDVYNFATNANMASPATFGDYRTPLFVDMNADGRPDLLYHDSHNSFFYALWNGSAFANTAPLDTLTLAFTPAGSTTYQNIETRLVNLSGRGQNDLLFVVHGAPSKTDQVWYAKSNGTTWSAPVQLTLPAAQTVCGSTYLSLNVQSVDWNLDGLDDLFISEDVPAACGVGTLAASQYQFYLSDGNGFRALGNALKLLYCGVNLQVADLGSGYLEIVCGNQTTVYAERSATGGPRARVATVPTTSGWFLADLNGDSNPDIVNITTGNVYNVALSTMPAPSRPDLITTFTTGLGAPTMVIYDAISHAPTFTGRPVYLNASSSSYPIINLDVPIYVVAEVQLQSQKSFEIEGPDERYLTYYSYGGAQADVTGRGFLGFQQLTVSDPQSGIQVDTHLRLDFPFAGMTTSEVKTVNGTVVSRSTRSYSSLTLGTGSATRVFPYLSQQVDRTWDLDGSPLPSVISAFQYDTYGNALQASVVIGDGNRKITTNTYTNDTAKWLLGRLTRSRVTVDNSGWLSSWTPTAAANAVDPNPFYFQPTTDAALGASITSSVVTLSGFTGTLTATANGAMLKVNGGSPVASASVSAGNTIQLVANAPAELGAIAMPSVKIGSYAIGYWSISSVDFVRTEFNAPTAGTTYTVPAGVTRIAAKIWGAGGGGNNYPGYAENGGAGGFTTGTIGVTPGQILTIYVGGGGTGSLNSLRIGAGGGGGSAVTRSDGVALLVAGGGGGASPRPSAANDAGAGGGASGTQQVATVSGPGLPGTQTAPGAAGAGGRHVGSAGSGHNGGAGYGWVGYAGGIGYGNGGNGGSDAPANTPDIGGGGGGGGWFGGGGGGADAYGWAGGGGSGYIGGPNVTGAVTTAGTGAVVPGTTDSDYVAGVGVGGPKTTGGNGGNGRVVIVGYH